MTGAHPVTVAPLVTDFSLYIPTGKSSVVSYYSECLGFPLLFVKSQTSNFQHSVPFLHLTESAEWLPFEEV